MSNATVPILVIMLFALLGTGGLLLREKRDVHALGTWAVAGIILGVIINYLAVSRADQGWSGLTPVVFELPYIVSVMLIIWAIIIVVAKWLDTTEISLIRIANSSKSSVRSPDSTEQGMSQVATVFATNELDPEFDRNPNPWTHKPEVRKIG